MKNFVLPNHRTIATLNRLEASMLYHEIFIAGAYAKHGIVINDTDCILDVGANIGMFALYVDSICQHYTLYAFEPVPAIFQVLQKNCSAQLPQVRTVNMGLSDQHRVVPFSFHPRLSMTAGRYDHELQQINNKTAGLVQWIHALLVDVQKVQLPYYRLLNLLIKGLEKKYWRTLVAGLVSVPLLVYLLFLRLTTKKVPCTLQTLHQFICEHPLPIIHLCKIDVEGSEWDVLQGIGEQQWSLFQQFIIEVHDINHRVQQIQQLLEQKGFEVVVDQEDWALHQLMHIYTVYAKRKTVS